MTTVVSSPSQVTWQQARQFCQSIYGDLLKFHNAEHFSDFLQYMRISGLTTDFWVGGRFDVDTNAWSWAVDNSVMPLGSPYWAVRLRRTCVLRPPPHTDPFSSPPAAPEGSPCFTNTQAPAHRQEGCW
ncbi:uncharacterized protein [Procambarus clarkii]|uniref:uncharacterized protein n=1 Tax=Procambarus clarkii TaxID=6728 RepID=UPI003742C05D